MKTIVIISSPVLGSASGASCAARLRRLDEKVKIIVCEETEYPSFASCAMPLYLSGEIENKEDLLVTSKELLEKVYNLDLRLKTKLMSIDRKNKKIILNNQTRGKYTEIYTKLVLCTGTVPNFPEKFKSIPNVFLFQDFYDMEKIAEKSKWSSSCIVYGAGLIGSEAAECLKLRGMEVTLIDSRKRPLIYLDKEMSHLLQKEFDLHGIKQSYGRELEKVIYDEDSDLLTVFLKNIESGEVEKMEVDFLIYSKGNRPNNEVAKQAGLKVNNFGCLVVNERMQTSDESIYSAADNVQTFHRTLNKQSYVPIANTANIQGRIVANSIYDVEPKVYKGSNSIGILKLFDFYISMLGVNEERLISEGIKYKKCYEVASDISLYMPKRKNIHQKNISIKFLWNPDNGKILGTQIMGKSGVGALSNSISTVMAFNGTIYDMQTIELPYCPQFGEVRSIVNMLGMIASGIMEGSHKIVHIEEVLNNKNDYILVDIRTPFEYNKEHFPGSINIPMESCRDKMEEKFKKDKKYVFICHVGKFGYMISKMLNSCGFNTYYLSGGDLIYQRHYNSGYNEYK